MCVDMQKVCATERMGTSTGACCTNLAGRMEAVSANMTSLIEAEYMVRSMVGVGTVAETQVAFDKFMEDIDCAGLSFMDDNDTLLDLGENAVDMNGDGDEDEAEEERPIALVVTTDAATPGTPGGGEDDDEDDDPHTKIAKFLFKRAAEGAVPPRPQRYQRPRRPRARVVNPASVTNTSVAK